MSHETPSNNSYDSIDSSRPYLVPRNSGQIETWHVEMNEDGSPKIDEFGWVVLSAQHEEENEAGEKVVPSKSAHPDALSDKVQSHYADILGQARRGATPEQFERYAAIEEDLAETALETMGLEDENGEENEESEQTEGRSPLLEEFFEETSFGSIDELKQQLATRTNMIEDELTQLDSMLSQAMYSGGSNEMINVQLRNSYESLAQLVGGSDRPDEALSERVAPLIHRAIEVNDAIRREESSSEESRYDARRLEETVGELDMANKVIGAGYQEIRQTFTPHGRFESYLEELMRTNQGYEMTISLLKADISRAIDAVFSIKAKINGVDYAIEDLGRLKNR